MGRISVTRKLFSALTAAALTASAVFLLSTCEPIALKTTISDMVLGWSRAVALISPEDGEFVADKTPTLAWSAAGGAVKYEVQVVETVDRFEVATVIEVTAPVTEYELETAQVIGNKRFWRVRALNAEGAAGEWSEARSFEIKPSAVPRIIWSQTIGDQVVQTKLKGNFAYVAAGNQGLKVIDISDPVNAAVIGRYPDPADGADQPITQSWGIEVSSSSDVLYITDYSGKKMQKLDISNPADPDHIATFDNTGDDDQLYFSLDMGFALFVGDDNELVNVNTDTMTKNTGKSFVEADRVMHMLMHGGHIYYTVDKTGLVARNANSLALVGTYPIPEMFVGGLAGLGEYLYVSGGPMGGNLEILNVSNPANPVLVKKYSTGNVGGAVGVVSHYVIVGTNVGLDILDVADPSAPVLVGSLPGTEASLGLFTLSGNYLYGGNWQTGKFYIIDLVPEE